VGQAYSGLSELKLNNRNVVLVVAIIKGIARLNNVAVLVFVCVSACQRSSLHSPGRRAGRTAGRAARAEVPVSDIGRPRTGQLTEQEGGILALIATNLCPDDSQ